MSWLFWSHQGSAECSRVWTRDVRGGEKHEAKLITASSVLHGIQYSISRRHEVNFVVISVAPICAPHTKKHACAPRAGRYMGCVCVESREDGAGPAKLTSVHTLWMYYHRKTPFQTLHNTHQCGCQPSVDLTPTELCDPVKGAWSCPFAETRRKCEVN